MTEQVVFGKEDFDELYRERTALLSWLTLHYPSTVSKANDDTGWNVLTLHTPAGPIGKHIAPDDMELLKHVIRNDRLKWDGADDDETFKRMRHVVEAMFPHSYRKD